MSKTTSNTTFKHILQDEVSSQLRQAGQHGPTIEAVINTSDNNGWNNNEICVIGLNGNRNTNGRGNGDDGNNENRV
jgi:hypothetical protein